MNKVCYVTVCKARLVMNEASQHKIIKHNITSVLLITGAIRVRGNIIVVDYFEKRDDVNFYI